MQHDIDDDDDRASAYREAAQHILGIIVPAVNLVMSAKSTRIGYAQLQFALGLEDRPMRDVASELGVTVACISKGANEFIRENNLPRPACMKSEAATRSYRNTRASQLS